MRFSWPLRTRIVIALDPSPQASSCRRVITPCCRAAIFEAARSGVSSFASIRTHKSTGLRILPLTHHFDPAEAGGPSPRAESDSIAAMAVSAQYSVTIRVELDARKEPLGRLTAAIAEAGGQLQGVDLVPGAGPEGKRVREFTIDATDREHWEKILRAIGSTRGARVLDYVDRTMQMHRGG